MSPPSYREDNGEEKEAGDDDDKNDHNRWVTRRPNRDLTEEERLAKKRLKRQLKYQSKLKGIKTRLRQAQMRNDRVVEREARASLEALLRLHEQKGIAAGTSRRTRTTTTTAVADGDDDGGNDSAIEEIISYRGEPFARIMVESTGKLLMKRLEQHDQGVVFDRTLIGDDAPGRGKTTKKKNKKAGMNGAATGTGTDTNHLRPKDYYAAHARELCWNMTRATQTESMFDNYAALRGYCSNKFVERAMLVVHSLGKLLPTPPSSSTCLTGDEAETTNINDFSVQNRHIITNDEFPKRLLSVRDVCCVGCGPGCDAVGLLAFLQSVAAAADRSPEQQHQPPSVASSATIPNVVLLDWTIDQWRRILGPLEECLRSSGEDTASAAAAEGDSRTAVTPRVGKLDLAPCDVRVSLLEGDANIMARELLIKPSEIEDELGRQPLRQVLACDLIITSYLLSETRGRWHAFYDDLVRYAKPGTLFLFTDPTAWQMHIFVDRCSGCGNDYEADRRAMDFVWLDSSMNQPELQALEGRVGPAVLLGMKR